jgi:hypothetical protein
MPYQRKRSKTAPDEVTAADVAQLWASATKEGPYPDNETNEQMARMMNHYRANPSFRVDPDQLNAVDVLLKMCAESYYEENGFTGRNRDFDALEDALKRVRPFLLAVYEGQKNAKKWDKAAAFLIWNVACGVLKNLGREAGDTRDSVAVRFTALALARLGWTNTGRPGLEVFIRGWRGGEDPELYEKAWTLARGARPEC